MSDINVFENIQNVLMRIDEIKRTFGLKREELNGEFSARLQELEDGIKIDRRIIADGTGSKVSGVTLTDRTEAVQEGSDPNAASAAGRGGAVEGIIKAASERYRIPQSLISAVIQQESGFNPAAVSPKGAMGFMQLMPETAGNLGVSDPFDMEENILGGTRYLRDLINLYEGNLNKALAAYNAGPNRVREAIPNIPETKDFVESVLDYYETFSKFQEKKER